MFRMIATTFVVTTFATTATAQPVSLTGDQMDVLTVAVPSIFLSAPSTSSRSPNFQTKDVAEQIGASTSPASVIARSHVRSLSSRGEQIDVRSGIASVIGTAAPYPNSTLPTLQAADMVPTAAPTPPVTFTALGITPPATINILNLPVMQGSDLMQRVGAATLHGTMIAAHSRQPFAVAVHPHLSIVPFATIEAMAPHQPVVRVGP